MITAFKAAKYLSNQYRNQYKTSIDEMKLHKLLYFAQRESLIQSGYPLFQDSFRGWRFGPVIPEIRNKFDEILKCENIQIDEYSASVLEETLLRYGSKDPWSLSRLTHGEDSWKKSREGLTEFQNGNNIIKLEDITEDAIRVKKRRELLSSLGIQ